jgi:2-keto-4-pentenoate hydratase/2-oxohepta-3-ene-1,7-dioic acid hydratase in catechol pathway
MRLGTAKDGERFFPCVVLDQSVVDLEASARVLPGSGRTPGSIREILAGGDGELDRIRSVRDSVMSAGKSLAEELRAAGAVIPIADAELVAPVRDPAIVLSCGMNYRAHLEEMGGSMPTDPTAFLKNANAVIGPDEPIVLPRDNPNMVDWEAEFSGVIGMPCHRVSVEDALEYVGGYTMINDVSARDWVKPMAQMSGMEAIRAWDDNLLGKQFPSFCPMGPTVATRNEIDPADAHFELKVNGEVMQSANTNDLVFSLAALIAHYSQFFRFQPGDVITTGCPAGAGMGRDPHVFLAPGDVVELSADGIGSMKNPVIASGASGSN